MSPNREFPRALKVEANENISFPIGTILAVEKYYERLYLPLIFGKHKKKGRAINPNLTFLVLFRFFQENLAVEFDRS